MYGTASKHRYSSKPNRNIKYRTTRNRNHKREHLKGKPKIDINQMTKTHLIHVEVDAKNMYIPNRVSLPLLSQNESRTSKEHTPIPTGTPTDPNHNGKGHKQCCLTIKCGDCRRGYLRSCKG
jgi:hypothetical protein